ncbi:MULTISPECIES: mechanosensitive ion channel family protein [Halocynthiibacter]|uniref:Mechanosensitive ion channel family protein n=1 Tax=Halocynthiibacter halioticoli TaxID=2986804 RepID=A0AAE3LTX3_9RHOB|nr:MULTISPECIES: mechanosensitive ion channel family protein [Halocynthiibacter]MCV6825941.1 mechanosensitive ion channel family protein [Halocynthiibacter halioticoli]MCW4058942.1 mechanosensitive ion channel family protein [Halocynthiibacter sp. SDUM655004]
MPFKEAVSDLVARVQGWLSSADQIGVLIAIVFVAIVIWLRKPLAKMVVGALDSLMTRLAVGLSDETKAELTVPTSILIATLSIFLALDVLQLPEFADGLVRRVLTSIAVLAVFAGWYNLCGPFVSLLSGETRLGVKMESGWMERVARFGVVLFGITALLTVWEVDISSALTGVGVLGAGLAIATQDLIRNLVAGMNNISEKRFSVGDVVQIEGVFVGTVEQIDLRSTLLRGFDQIPRYIPNSELANAVVLNYSQRRNRRVKLSIPLVLATTQAQILEFCDTLRKHLKESGDFDVSEDAPQYVHVEGLSDSAVLVMFYAWTNDPDYANFLEVTERLTLKIMELASACDTALAYPTQTLNMPDSTSDL